MQFIVKDHRDGTVEVTLHPETKKTIALWTASAVISAASLYYVFKK